jgi:hypothetical protein
VNNVRLPALIREFLEQQAIANPRYEQPRPPKPYTELVKPTWLIWGAVAIIVFQLTVIVSLGAPLRGSLRDRLSNWYVVALSLLMIALGAIGGWWWLKSVYKQAHKKRLLQSDVYQFKYKYSYRQYSKAEKLLERQQHRKLHKLLSGKCPKLISQSTITPEEKKLKVFLKKKFPFLQVKHRVKCLIKEDWVEVEWVIISERTKVFLGVFFEDDDQDYYLRLLEDGEVRDRLLAENWVILEVTSLESLIQVLYYLVYKVQLL